jgi:hypothetical protein
LKNYYINYERTGEGVEYLKPLISQLVLTDENSGELAKIHNVIGMMAWIHNDYDTCIEYTKRAYEEFDGESAYVYNLLLAYEKTRGENDAVFQQWLDRLAGYSQLSLSSQEYLMQHGRTYAGTTIEEPDDLSS